jgi:glycosyltransferase involved in cell wall biosynthesis
VSFVMAAFDAEATIAASIRSALAQDEPDIELIVVDDGSSDGTLELARDAAADDDRVTVLTQANAGPAAARNRALVQAQARYIAFLDADDLVHAAKARVQAEFLDVHETVGLVYSPASEFDGDDPTMARPMEFCTDPAELSRSLRCRGFGAGFPLHSALVRREALEQVGGLRELEPLVEDLDLWVRLVRSGLVLGYVDRPPDLCRRRAGSRSSHRINFVAGLLPILDWLWERREGEDATCRETLRICARHRALILAGLLASAGRTAEARNAVRRARTFDRSLGERLESLRFLVRPTDVPIDNA